MQSPMNFKLEPLEDKNKPAPFPPSITKSKLLKMNSQMFYQADIHALAEVKINYRNFKDMMWNLVYKKSWTEIERARIIFTWMREKNLNTINFDNAAPNSAEYLFQLFRDSQTSYSSLFDCIAQNAGLYCVIITGWVKGVEYRPGQPITSGPTNHSWNALYVEGNWHLVDSMWASRYVQKDSKISDSFVKKRMSEVVGEIIYDSEDFYFMSDPSLLIYSHIPVESSWQLLHPVVSKQMFESLPKIKSYFFTSGMLILSEKRGVISTRDGVLTLTLGYSKPSLFEFNIVREGAAEDSVPLKKYAIQEITKNRYTLYFRSPKEGTYYLTIYAQLFGTYLQTTCQYKAVCEYKVICDQPAKDIRPFPNCFTNRWGGYTNSLQDLNIKPNKTNAILIAEPQSAIKIELEMIGEIPIQAFLKRNGINENALNQCVQIVPYNKGVYIEVRPKETGEYGLDIFGSIGNRESEVAKENKLGGEDQAEFIHLCQYLLLFSSIPFQLAYGKIYDREDIMNNKFLPIKIAPRESLIDVREPKYSKSSISSHLSEKKSNLGLKMSGRESVIDIYEPNDKQYKPYSEGNYPSDVNILRKKNPNQNLKHSSSVKIPSSKNLALKPRGSLRLNDIDIHLEKPDTELNPKKKNGNNEVKSDMILNSKVSNKENADKGNENSSMNIYYSSKKKKVPTATLR